MDIEFFKISFAAIGVLALALGIFAAVRTKDVGVGLVAIIYLILFSVLIYGALFGVFGLVYAYGHYVSERTQRLIGALVIMVGGLMMAGVIFVLGRRAKKAGKLVTNGQAKSAYLAQGMGIFLYIYLMLANVFATFSRLPYPSRNDFWWVVIICCAPYWYYSTEWREKGFVYRGKVIPFNDVVHARWEYKTKLKVKLRNSEQELAFTVPAEIATAIDNYLRANFPNP